MASHTVTVEELKHLPPPLFKSFLTLLVSLS